MILWFTIVQVTVAVAAGLLCVGFGLAGRKPADITLGSLVLVELLLIAQLILAIVQPFGPAEGAHEPAAIILRSRSERMRSLSAIQAALAGIALGATLLAIVVSYGVARTICELMKATPWASR